MKKTAIAMSVTLALMLAAISGHAAAQTVSATSIQSLRGSEVATEDKAFDAKDYQGKRPGRQKVVARTFAEQPPVIPHAVENFDDINLEENQCLSCHSLEKAKEKNAPKVGASHFKNPRTGEIMKDVSAARHNCTNCHVPQVDARPLVENAFQGNPVK